MALRVRDLYCKDILGPKPGHQKNNCSGTMIHLETRHNGVVVCCNVCNRRSAPLGGQGMTYAKLLEKHGKQLYVWCGAKKPMRIPLRVCRHSPKTVTFKFKIFINT